MAQYFPHATPTNFDVAVSDNTNSFWMPAVYSKKVLNFFRKASVAEAITNTDYSGEINKFGDTVNIVKEPTITVTAYTRGLTLTDEKLTDEEISLVVDTANSFRFTVDDIESSMSHINWKETAASAAAYALSDAFDSGVLSVIKAGVATATPDHTLGTDSATPLAAGVYDGAGAMDIGVASESDPLDVMARCARLLDDSNVPEDNRWFVAAPEWYEQLSQTSSKLMSVDYNGGQGSVRNGLVAEGKLRGFSMYKSNNLPAPTNATGQFFAGHMSAVATAQTIIKTETLRSTENFGDICRGLHVYGAKVLRDEALIGGFYIID